MALVVGAAGLLDGVEPPSAAVSVWPELLPPQAAVMVSPAMTAAAAAILEMVRIWCPFNGVPVWCGVHRVRSSRPCGWVLGRMGCSGDCPVDAAPAGGPVRRDRRPFGGLGLAGLVRRADLDGVGAGAGVPPPPPLPPAVDAVPLREHGVLPRTAVHPDLHRADPAALRPGHPGDRDRSTRQPRERPGHVDP